MQISWMATSPRSDRRKKSGIYACGGNVDFISSYCRFSITFRPTYPGLAYTSRHIAMPMTWVRDWDHLVIFNAEIR